MGYRVWVAVGLVVCFACQGRHEGAGDVTRVPVPPAIVGARSTRQDVPLAHRPPEAGRTKQILFGDLHVHTTFSADAFIRSLPLLQGEGAHPPADACDFARFCSDLDFWSITDHAESISPEHWRETKESVRQCNTVAGDPKNPDLVTYLGFEWTQVGLTPADHYGHKNVIFRETAEDRVPKRPISALDERLIGALRRRPPLWERLRFPLLDFPNRQRYYDFGRFQNELDAVPLCPAGVDTRALPENCNETAHTPRELFEKLAQWGFEAIVIPHGNTWGLYTPPGSSWDKQLVGPQHDADRQTLIEVYSGHGNSEQYRDWRDVTWGPDGEPACPAPTPTYLPCCWQAGELVRAKCGGVAPAECERRVAAARINFLKAGAAGRMTLPNGDVEDWKDCGQCRDCFLPAFNYRPQSSVQYAMAISNFDDPAHPRRFRFGFIGSSDNHSARPGTGYKEFARRVMTEAAGPRDEKWRDRTIGPPKERPAESVPYDPGTQEAGITTLQVLDFERAASFFLTGGLVGVHATGRDRDSIWDALQHREVYGTSGDRILLWFELLGPDGTLPMGAETTLAVAPVLRVRAVGAFKQKPGCPESTVQAAGRDRLQHLCRGECYNPSDERKRITRIEVVRIRPQATPGEPVAGLIEDPWKRLECRPDSAGCEVSVEDDDFVDAGRDTLYYARAIEEPSPAVNADGLRCSWGPNGECTEVHPCYGDYRTPYDEDCLARTEERAWSSPIYIAARRPGPGQ
jgi:hypothetical protein